jgi:RNA polymerase sigma-70 factor (ECF subfamily)
MENAGDITLLLKRQADGDRAAERELFACLYDSLHAMAGRRLRAERNDHTLQPTALIHELYLVIFRSEKNIDWKDRGHFFAVAARIMRRILVDHARKRHAAKRLGKLNRVDLDKAQVFSLDNPEFVIALDRSMTRLREFSERACQVVEMRAFGGLEMEDIASSLGISARTVKRDWQTARMWLYKDLYQEQA